MNKASLPIPDLKAGLLENHLEIIRYFSRSIFRRNTTEDILWDIARNCIQKLGFEDCVIYLVDKDRHVLVQKAAYGPKNIDYVQIAEPIEINIGEGIVGTVAQTGESELILNCAEDPRYIVDDAARLSELCVPIIHDNKVIGVIDSEHPLPDFYTTEHKEILESIAIICATKIAMTLVEEENEVLARFVEENPEAVLRIGHDGAVLNHNRAAKRLIQYWNAKEGVVLNQSVMDKIAETLKTGETMVIEERYDELVISLLIAPVVSRDYVNVFATNTTEIVQAKNAAVQASKAKDEFLSVMSHEMRTPLNAIMGTTHLLKDTSPSPKQHSLLQTLEFSARNLQSHINDILDFEKIIAGKIIFENETFKLHETLEGIYKSFYSRASENGSKLTLDIDQNVPERIKGDETRLIQILNNLLSNAIKFTSDGMVHILITVEYDSQKDPNLKIVIADTGIGIDAEKMITIFNPFEQATSSTTRKYGGTGLGLTITKQLVEMKGGSIDVESELGHGSTFTVVLPFEPEGRSDSGDDQQELSENTADFKGRTVLVVDDNPINLLVAEEFLKKWNLIVASANNGEEALDKYNEVTPDIVLMDLQMPICDGFEATRNIRSKGKNGAHVPIIALTADAMLRTQTEALLAGMNDILTKPFNPQELVRKINTFLSLEKF